MFQICLIKREMNCINLKRFVQSALCDVTFRLESTSNDEMTIGIDLYIHYDSSKIKPSGDSSKSFLNAGDLIVYPNSLIVVD